MKLRLSFARTLARVAAFAILPASLAGLASTAPLPASADNGCQLQSPGGAIKHVIELQFDNVHFTRDNPNVPSDLEQMPNLLNFITGNGVLDVNHHTPLISHTADDILTTLTGVYGSTHGQPVANSYGYFNPDGTVGFNSSFTYWTDKSKDGANNMVTSGGLNTPAPWVPFTRAGCDVGGVGTANIELENTSTAPTGDITKVFGANSPEWNEALTNPHLALTDFVGIAIHCAQSASSKCAGNANGRADLLNDEPGGYNGFNALYGAKYVNPAINGGAAAVDDTSGSPITDADGNPGFPGFDGMLAKNTLGYVAAMQESGVPVTYGYISDAHDIHVPNAAADAYFSHAAGPGEADYVAQLRAYDQAFGSFFADLAAHGITRSNTLFVFTADEGDHFAGGAPSPANCDGVTIACTYPTLGEIDANLTGLMANQGVTTPFAVHSDDAPTVYVDGNPAPTAPITRAFERAAAGLVDPQSVITGQQTPLAQRLADPVEMKILHMVTADPARTPTFTLFGNPDYFMLTSGSPCSSEACFQEGRGFAWNHGDFQSEIVNTWLGLVGPGVLPMGVTSSVWSDHTDIRPTILSMVGLKDDYAHQGRVLFELLNASAVPLALRDHRGVVQQLAAVYKQLNASVGSFGLNTLQASTRALESGTASDDSTYTNLEAALASLGNSRDALAGQIQAALEGAAFDSQPINVPQAQGWIAQGQALLGQAAALANN
jgi:hypothetical protein